jgi:protease-4
MDSTNKSQESILLSALRSFLKSFSSALGIFVFILLLVVVFASQIPSNRGSKTVFSFAPDSSGNRVPLGVNTPCVLKINLEGIIGAGKLTTQNIESLLLDSREGLLKQGRVKAVLLCINTPGGSVTDSNGIYEAIKSYKEKYKVPVYAYVDGTCASGGMYISSAADAIYSSSVSIIGSVGVILGPLFNFHDLMQNLGIKTKTISRGKDKEMLNPFTPWKPGEESSLYAITDYLYSHFVSIVCQARRGVDKEKLINDYGAQVFAAPKAMEIGYIDSATATYSSTLCALTTAANITESEKYQVVELSPAEPLLGTLLQGKTRSFLGQFVKGFFFKEDSKELNEPFLYLYDPKLLGN